MGLKEIITKGEEKG
jgi:hypothetical protein